MGKVSKREQLIPEIELARYAKLFRIKSGISKSEAARQLKVGRAAIHEAEEDAGTGLTKLRVRMIEKYSPYRIFGPAFVLRNK